MSAAGNKTKSLALVAAPWPLYNRPSIQIGTLKSYLRRQFPDLPIGAHHLYLPLAAAVGYDIYQTISERTWLAEAVYAAALFPERFDKINAFFRRQAARQGPLRSIRLEDLSANVRQRTDRLLNEIKWDDCAMVGFSVSLCQFSATLYLARRIKQINPAVTCVVGGSTFSGIPPGPVFKLISEIDLIVSGEGEQPLAHLVQSLLVDHIPLKDLTPMKGIFSRQADPATTPDGFNQMTSLDRLPPPDYDDYFEILAKLPPANHFFATLPMELSRGCWWQRPHTNGKSGCAFCNLNLQWQGYRHKSADRGLAEIDRLTSRHQTLSIAFTDNVLPSRPAAKFFDSLHRFKKDLRLFGEIRATTQSKDMERMAAAGMNEVQVGIEALSSALLKKLRKGTRVIENLSIMKECEELGVRNVSNLILLLPGSDIRDVEETLYGIEFAQSFRPLKAVDFWLGMGSPLWLQPREAGIQAVFNHPNWAHLFPESIARKFPFSVLGYRGDRGIQRRLWRPVRMALKKWDRDWRQLRRGPENKPILSYRDGRDFIIIKQRRPAAPALTHRLTAMSAKIYRICRRPQPLAEICAACKDLPLEKIRVFLDLMVSKRLMYAEDDDFLSLAVAERPRCRSQ